MLAYVNLVQRREKELECDVLTHQKWSGASLIDGMLGAIQSGNSGSKSMGEGNTEDCEFSMPTLTMEIRLSNTDFCEKHSDERTIQQLLNK